MKYSLSPIDVQDALIQFFLKMKIDYSLLDLIDIIQVIHFDDDEPGTYAQFTNSSTSKPTTFSSAAAPGSRASKRKDQREQEKRRKHLQLALQRKDQIYAVQAELIGNAEMEEESRNSLFTCLNAVLDYQLTFQLDFITGLPKAEIEHLRSLPRKKSVSAPSVINHSSEETGPSLQLPSSLEGFINTRTFQLETQDGFPYFVFYGEASTEAPVCPVCGKKMSSKGRDPIILKHIPIGKAPSFVMVERKRFACNNPKCKHTMTPSLPFQDEKHRITKELREMVELLLSATFNLKDTSEITGVGINTVKEIDLVRLKRLYTENGEKLKKPESYSTFLSIDEFKLHDGHQYATIIIDLETRHILWVQRGKKKDVVYKFFEHVGNEWMSHVKAVACDMNSDFQEAFEDRYPHIRVVFDHFHIVKNFNEKVIAKIRIDEQKRLMDAGETKAAQSLKRSKYILTASRKTLKKQDEEAAQNKTTCKGTTLFNEKPSHRKGGKLDRYEALIKENELLFACDFVKSLLQDAYITTDDPFKDRLAMGKKIQQIIRICQETKNEHFIWFANLLVNHRKGVVAHATFPITSGIIEGINQKIKTVRRNGYGYPDDEYFFLKIIDASRVNYADVQRKRIIKPYIHVDSLDIRNLAA